MANNKPDMTNEIVSILKQEIERGDYGTRGILPSQSQVAGRFGVSHSTIARVMLILQAMCLVVPQGRNVLANPRHLRIPILTPSFDGFLQEQGCVPHFEYVGEPEIIELDATLARECKLEPGTKALRRLRLQGEKRDGEPIGKRKSSPPFIIWYRLSETLYRIKELEYLAGDEFDAWMEQVKTNSRFNLVKHIEQKTGQKITHAVAHHLIRLPNEREQYLLNINLLTPIVEQYRVCYNEDDSMILMFNHILYVGPYCVFEYDSPVSI